MKFKIIHCITQDRRIDMNSIRENYTLYSEDPDGILQMSKYLYVGQFSSYDEAERFAKKVKSLQQPTIELDI